ncbi:transmembrane protein 201-like [Gigantopelta aegis]|uniref:transmembrane protein 201-like n=1 Tax=Gigantopelta aegis TaxID=1735272 RepID=UPI001B888D44|nr:transmembrane protein 201-like [Gigantopelta aegis]
MFENIRMTFSWLDEAVVSPGYVVLALAAMFLILLVYKLMRRKCPVRVSCWFCMFETVVPYGNRNCWDCPQCEQYNGFTEDGDYNKPIPAQHVEDLNYPVKCKPDAYLACQTSICRQCEQNQILKIKQLAMFTPISEDTFESEIEVYERYLEKEYQLCSHCRLGVNRELHKQDDILRVGLQGTKFDTSDSADFNNSLSQSEEVNVDNRTYWAAAGRVVAFVAWLISSGLLSCDHFSTISHSVRWISSGLLASDHFSTISRSVRSIPLFADGWSYFLGSHVVISQLVQLIAGYQLMLVIAGFLLCLLSKVIGGRKRLSALDLEDCLTWLLCILGSVSSPSWVGATVLSMIIAANFMTSLVGILCTRDTKKDQKCIRRVSLGQSETPPDPDSNVTHVSPDSATTNEQSYSTSRQIVADDLDLEFSTMSVDPLGVQLKRSDSGIFSCTGSLSSMASMSRLPTGGKPRPILTPSRLNIIRPSVFSETNSIGHAGQQQMTKPWNSDSQENLFQLSKPRNSDSQENLFQLSKTRNSDSQGNLFQLSSRTNDSLHLFSEEDKHTVPALKPSLFDSINFTHKTSCGQNANIPNKTSFGQNTNVPHNTSFGQNANVPNKTSFGQKTNFTHKTSFGESTNSLFTGSLFSQKSTMDGQMFTQNPYHKPGSQHCRSPNGILQAPRLFDSACRTSSRSQFPENLNFSTNSAGHQKVFNSNMYADNPFCRVQESRTSPRNRKFRASGYPVGRERMLFDDDSFTSVSTNCVDQIYKKGFSWTPVVIGCVLGASILINASLAVYVYLFSSV